MDSPARASGHHGVSFMPAIRNARATISQGTASTKRNGPNEVSARSGFCARATGIGLRAGAVDVGLLQTKGQDQQCHR